jgi:hypothetical protein
VLQVKENVDWPLSAADGNGFAVYDSRKRRKALLTVEKEFPASERGRILTNCKIPSGDWLVSLPHQYGAAWIPSIEGIEQIANAGRFPDVVALNFGKAQFTAFVHVYQGADRNVLLLH